MTKEEILKELHYHSKYTKDVKKRLNKLIKKYHPDRNKKDSKTILLLYNLKKEFENNDLVYIDDTIIETNESDEEFNKISNNYIYFLEAMVQRLKKQKDEISKKLKSLYKRINNNIDKTNTKEEELGEVSFIIEELEKEIYELSKVDIIDKIIIGLFSFLLIVLIFSRSIIVGLIMIIIIVLEIYYVSIRNVNYNDKFNRLKKLKAKNKKVEKEYEVIKNKFERLEKRERKLKKEKQRINNDIQFYNNEISKAKEKERNKEKKKRKSSEKTYRK